MKLLVNNVLVKVDSYQVETTERFKEKDRSIWEPFTDEIEYVSVGWAKVEAVIYKKKTKYTFTKSGNGFLCIQVYVPVEAIPMFQVGKFYTIEEL